MSGLMRTIEKKIMRKAGIKRVSMPNADPVKPDHVLVYDENSEETYGSRWPSLIPRRFVPPVQGRDYEARLAREEKRHE